MKERKSIEIQRHGVTKARFNAHIRRKLKGTPLEGWIDSITLDIGIKGDAKPYCNHQYPTDCHYQYNAETGQNEYGELGFEEIYAEGYDSLQMYYKPSPKMIKEYTEKGLDISGYNFTYEFTYDDDKTGYGYFWLIEF